MNYPRINTNKYRFRNRKLSVSVCVYLWIVFFALFFTACAELEKPKTEPFYSQTSPPQKKEFRWSNGKMPKSFDPALASAPPETDIVRAVFEGLTDTNPQTLEAIPAIATKWEASEDFKTWTFHLRKDAKWSNGERITAKDFERSWKRLADLGVKVSHHKLLQNIVGIKSKEIIPIIEDTDVLSNLANQSLQALIQESNTNNSNSAINQSETAKSEKAKIEEKETKLGIEAVDNFTFKVSLVNADKNFPALVAHPIFRPVYGDGKQFESNKLDATIITNGAFRITSIGQDGITLDRAENFWNKDSVELERVRFVPTENAETALQFYRAGELDAVTNVDFAPLALKLLEPYDDFHRTTHSALNFYEFNLEKSPFNDRRVREALAIAIERERLTEGATEGATIPALNFLPFSGDKNKLTQDLKNAKNLLAEAGFPNGENFPTIRLIINRNDIQQKIARSIAKMWEQNLNLKTEIIVKESGEIQAIIKSGDFDILRRGAVFPVADETANMLAIFPPKVSIHEEMHSVVEENNIEESQKHTNSMPEITINKNPAETTLTEETKVILTEEQAINELPAIPLYYPMTYSLVKPYIIGFEMNTLDAPSLKNVKIDNNWQPQKANGGK